MGNGGAVVNVITKSGGRQYHGTGYWYKRHEMFNANDFFNKGIQIGIAYTFSKFMVIIHPGGLDSIDPEKLFQDFAGRR
jgi:hypothetical protein